MKDINHWSKIQERGTYLGIQTLLIIYRIFGRKILSIFLFPIVVYLYFTGGESKKASLSYLNRIDKIKSWRQPVNYRLGIRHFYVFAQSALDKIDAWLGKIPIENIIYEQDHPLPELEKKKQGAIFIGSHLGNLEVCRALGHGRYKTRINVLVFTHHAVEFNRVLQKINPNSNVDLIQVDIVNANLAIVLKERIDNGEILVIAGDRTSVTSQGRIINADFLGEQAPFSQGPFILASILECPVYFLFCLKDKKHYKVIFEHVADTLKFARKERAKGLDDVVKLFAQRLEFYCLRYPFQWFNFFDFWRNDGDVIREEQVSKIRNKN